MAQQLDTSVLPRTGLLARNNFRVARHTTKIVLSSGHVPHQHRFTGILGLGCQSGFAFGHKTNMLMDGLGLCVSAAFGSNDLRFRETHEELVGILGVPEPNQACRVDFVQDCDVGIHLWVRGKRIFLKRLKRILESRGVRPEMPNRLHGLAVCAVGQFDRRIGGLYPIELVGGNIGGTRTGADRSRVPRKNPVRVRRLEL